MTDAAPTAELIGDPVPPARKAAGKALIVAASVLLVLVILAVLVYSVLTTPRSAAGRSGLQSFDPESVGRLEQRAWAAYYWRQWPQLFDLLHSFETIAGFSGNFDVRIRGEHAR